MSLFTEPETNFTPVGADTGTSQSGVDSTRSAAAATTRRTDRPATALLPALAADSRISPALESVDQPDSAADAAARLRRPMRNLARLFSLVMNDLEALPILQSQMLSEANNQLEQIQQSLERLTAGSATVGISVAQQVFDALRSIRTPLANMQGILSLVLDDRTVLAAPVVEMLLLAFEQLEKLAHAADAIAERQNLSEGRIAVSYRDTALEQILELAIRNARDEGFDAELVTANQVSADVLPEIDATRSQCLEALVRHALLDTAHFSNTQPIGLFVYLHESEDGAMRLAIEIHDHCERDTVSSDGRQGTLDHQIVTEMTQALHGRFERTVDLDGETTTIAHLPIEPLGTPAVVASPAVEETTAMTNAYRGVAFMASGRCLAKVIDHTIAQQLMIGRVDSFDALIAAMESAWLPTVFVDSDLIANLDESSRERFTVAAERLQNLYILLHSEADVGDFAAGFPALWDDDLVAITGMLEQPFQPGAQQENLVLLTGDADAEIRPWRKLLSATGHGAMWWPAARPIAVERFPSTIGSVVVLTAATRSIPTANWQTLAQLKVRDRRILVLTGHDTCQLPGARGWDIYRPNLQACDDTLRRYILFNSPARQAPRVAVIEDDLLMRKLLTAAVEDHAQIVEIATVADAVEKLRTQAFDVILLDLYLPDGSGLRILEAIRQDPRLARAARTPILTLTASSDLDINRQALELGAAEVLVKPVPMQVLRQKIALLTRQSRSTRISGPVTVPPSETTEKQVPAKPAAAAMANPRASKIINLRQLKDAVKSTPCSQHSGAGD